MKKIITFILLVVASPTPFLASPPSLNVALKLQTENITATITKETTESQLNDLKSYFKKHDISLTIKKVSRNSENEITGLKISLQKNGQQSSYNMQSNTPITDLELGFKNENVFIGNASDSMAMAFGNGSPFGNLLNSLNQNESAIDSLISENQFSFSFNSNDLQKFLKDSSLDFDQIQEQFFSNFFNSNGNSSGKQSFSSPNISPKKQGSVIPKYTFFNNKNINKLIIIDGKESDFETLDALAKADKLTEVDNLKPSTAISIYGNKAKDGAIIATTK